MVRLPIDHPPKRGEQFVSAGSVGFQCPQRVDHRFDGRQRLDVRFATDSITARFSRSEPHAGQRAQGRDVADQRFRLMPSAVDDHQLLGPSIRGQLGEHFRRFAREQQRRSGFQD